VLTLAGARCDLTGRLSASGGWLIRFPAPGRLQIIAVLRGSCTYSSARSPEIEVQAGEALAVNGAEPFELHTDRDAIPVAATEMTVPLHRIGGGEDFSGVGGELAVAPGGEALLGWALPEVLHLTRSSPQAPALLWLLQEMDAEMGSGRAGAVSPRTSLPSSSSCRCCAPT
jgi:hypothetical protein